MARRRLVVVGGDAAGMSAASQARRMQRDEELEILAFERSPHTSYSACGLPYYASGVVPGSDALLVRSPEQFRERQIQARVGTEVTSIDLNDRLVRTIDLSTGTESDVAFDELLIATGTVPIRPKIPGIELAGIFGLGTLQSGIDLRRALDEQKPRNAVIVGAGYIGLEMAEALVHRGVGTTVIEALSQPMASLDEEMGALVADALTRAGVNLVLEEKVLGFESRDGSVAAVVSSSKTHPADLVILGLGTAPNIALAEAAGIEIGASGAIRVDDTMRSTQPGVWTAGDCAEQVHRVTGKPVNFHLGTIANKMGRVAGSNIAGGNAVFPGVLGTAITKVCDVEVARTGLSSKEAEHGRIEFTAASITSKTRSGYYPGAEPMAVRVLAETSTRRIIGAQIVGGPGSAKRIDVFATGIWSSMTVDEMELMDLSYAPPFSPVWDPVLIAARRVAEAL